MVATLNPRKALWLVSFPKDGSRVLVKNGEDVVAGDKLVEIEESRVDFVDISCGTHYWTNEKKNEQRTKLRGLTISPGQELVKGVVIGCGGVVEDVDEFMVAKLRCSEVCNRILLSPVNSRVNDVSETSLRLHFKAIEIPLRGVVYGKVWGDGNFQILRELGDLNGEYRGKIIFLDKYNKGLLTKAEVLDVAGVIIVSDDDMEISDNRGFPVALIGRAMFELITQKFDGEGWQRILLNTKAERMLVVVQ